MAAEIPRQDPSNLHLRGVNRVTQVFPVWERNLDPDPCFLPSVSVLTGPASRSGPV